MGIDVVELIPQFEETLLENCGVAFGEITEEALEYLYLLWGEVIDRVEFVKVAKECEYHFGIGKVLVNVVEIGEHEFSPTIELLEGFVLARNGAIGFVELADELDAVCQLEAGHGAEELTNGDIAWAPQRAVAQLDECLVEEERGTLVGEYDCNVVEVGAVLV